MYSNPEYVTGQYRDASKLNARVALHERFSTNARGLQRWVFDHFELPQEARILDVGSGRRRRGRRTGAAEFGRRVSELVEVLEHELASRGAISIAKHTGVFVARG